MFAVGYQTNPNYLGICWGFFDRHAPFPEILGLAESEEFADKGEFRFSYSYRSHDNQLSIGLLTHAVSAYGLIISSSALLTLFLELKCSFS